MKIFKIIIAILLAPVYVPICFVIGIIGGICFGAVEGLELGVKCFDRIIYGKEETESKN